MNMGVSLTENQRARLEEMAGKADRSMSNFIGRLIDLEWETRAAYQERDADNAGAQNPETQPELTI